MTKTLWSKYPKSILLIVIYVITIISSSHLWNQLFFNLNLHGRLWEIFLCGWFYAYAFTAAPATAMLLILAKDHSLIIASLVGGLGALISDVLIFLFVKQTFMTEVTRLKSEPIATSIANFLTKIMGKKVKYFLPVIAGLFIASPLPTEVGIIMLASLKRLSISKFIFLAYGLHTLGILIILYLGRQI